MRTLSVFVFSAGLVLASCGGTSWKDAGGPTAGGSSPTQARLLAAITHTTDAKTARIAIHLALRGVGPGMTESIDGTGVINLTNHSTDLTVSVGPPAPQSIEIHVLGGTVYTRVGRQWTSVTATESTKRGSTDPIDYVSYLRGVSGDVREIGHEPVRGVDTTKYTATVSLQRALESSSATADERARAKRALDTIGDVALPASAWIDAQGRLRRFSITIDMQHAFAGQGLALPAGVRPSMSAEVEFYDFGVAVHVQPPPGATAAAASKAKAADRAAQSDLRNALTAEKTIYTDNQAYDASASTMRAIEPSLGWGGKLTVVVGDAVTAGDKGVVCVSEMSNSGTTFSLGDVSAGPRAGTYYGKVPCPPVPTPVNVSRLPHTGW